MASISQNLRIKYGLGRDPAENIVRIWVDEVQRRVRQGESAEAAGATAAKLLFPDYRTRFYASEADTIETLLTLAGDK